jgi:hypothetical protein
VLGAIGESSGRFAHLAATSLSKVASGGQANRTGA